jgi:hypothetical protein
LKRAAPARPRLKATDRLILVCLYRLFPSLLDASLIFKPEMLPPSHPRSLMIVENLRALIIAVSSKPR